MTKMSLSKQSIDNLTITKRGNPTSLLIYPTRMKDNIIKDQEQYETTRDFFIKYSNTLLKKKHILRKDPLQEIKHSLITKGHLHFKYHYRLLNSYLKQEKNLNYINITEQLYSLELFKKEQKQESQSYTLPI
jgi:hypothetical protein